MTNESPNTSSLFEQWWAEEGLKTIVPVYENSHKEIALKAWNAAGERCLKICEYWPGGSSLAIRSYVLPKDDKNK